MHAAQRSLSRRTSMLITGLDRLYIYIHVCMYVCQDKASMGTQQQEKAVVPDGEPLRPEGTVKATEEERGLLTCKTSLSRVYDGPGPKPSGRPGADIPSSESCSMSYKVSRTVDEQRYRNSVKSSQSYPGAHVDSDHNLVAMRVELKLKKLKRGGRNQRKWDIAKLKRNEDAFRRGIERDVRPSAGRTAEGKWIALKENI